MLRFIRILAVFFVAAGAVACSSGDDDERAAGGDVGVDGSDRDGDGDVEGDVEEGSRADVDGPWTVEFDWQFGSTVELAVEPIERRDDRSVLPLTVTARTQDGEPVFSRNLLGHHLTGFQSVRGLHLVDPVGQRYYTPLRSASGDSVSSELPTRLRDGVHYRMQIHYPALPETTDVVTLLAPSQVGPLTGIPVVGGSGETPTADVGSADVEPGDTVVLPVDDDPADDQDGTVSDLFGITEGTVISRDYSTTEETVAVAADVLFDFDADTLGPEAAEVLDGVIAETEARADPDKPPIHIVGHTDSVGDRAYNQDLSLRRAESVRAYLEAGLGSEYVYAPEGRGETEPVADEGGADDEAARARNRRVEISYELRDEFLEAEIVESEEVTEERSAYAIGPPAERVWVDGDVDVVGTLTGSRHERDFTIDVHPFVRDGAYLVGRVTITHTGDSYNTVHDYFGHGDYAGAVFGQFSAVDPSTDTTYRAVRVGPKDGTNIAFVDNPYFPPTSIAFEAGTANFGYFYVPAPPVDVESVTFDGGDFGTVPDVPVL